MHFMNWAYLHTGRVMLAAGGAVFRFHSPRLGGRRYGPDGALGLRVGNHLPLQAASLCFT